MKYFYKIYKISLYGLMSLLMASLGGGPNQCGGGGTGGGGGVRGANRSELEKVIKKVLKDTGTSLGGLDQTTQAITKQTNRMSSEEQGKLIDELKEIKDANLQLQKLVEALAKKEKTPVKDQASEEVIAALTDVYKAAGVPLDLIKTNIGLLKLLIDQMPIEKRTEVMRLLKAPGDPQQRLEKAAGIMEEWALSSGLFNELGASNGGNNALPAKMEEELLVNKALIAAVTGALEALGMSSDKIKEQIEGVKEVTKLMPTKKKSELVRLLEVHPDPEQKIKKLNEKLVAWQRDSSRLPNQSETSIGNSAPSPKGIKSAPEIEQGRQNMKAQVNPITKKTNCTKCDKSISDEDLYRLSCGHEFHHRCIAPLLEKQLSKDHKFCPFCYENIR